MLIRKTAIAAVLLAVAASATAQLAPEEFTSKFIENLRQINADVGIKDVEALQFVVTTQEGDEHKAFLDNAYDLYLQDEAALQEIMNQYADALLESVTRVEPELLAENIVPVIKATAWLEEVARVTREQGQDSEPNLCTQPLVEGLVVVYAEDTPSNIRYIGREDIEETGVGLEQVATLSIDNLLQRLPQIETHGGEGLYMVTAGGNYEPSLLLIDTIWNADNFDVRGDIVIGVPARDVLLVTGSEETESLSRLVAFGEEIYAESPYRLTTNLYVWRDGAWQRHEH